MRITLIGGFTPDELREVADLVELREKEAKSEQITTHHGQHSNYTVRLVAKSIGKVTVRNEYKKEERR
jgi:nucleoside phosphorylase